MGSLLNKIMINTMYHHIQAQCSPIVIAGLSHLDCFLDFGV